MAVAFANKSKVSPVSSAERRLREGLHSMATITTWDALNAKAEKKVAECVWAVVFEAEVCG